MLPQVVLDDERFAQIAERAKERICQIMPEWTDHNAHDPGITVLELFAWMKEMQQFHMDRITKEHRLSYLRLMGVVPEKIRAARAVVLADPPKQPVFFPKGSRFYAEEVCFETVTEIRSGPEEITGLSVYTGHRKDSAAGNSAVSDSAVSGSAVGDSVAGNSAAGNSAVGDSVAGNSAVSGSAAGDSAAGLRRKITPAFFKRAEGGNGTWGHEWTVRRGSSLCVPVFGERPGEGSVLRMKVSGALEPRVLHSIHISPAYSEAFRRNPIGDAEDFFPLAELSLRYRGRRGMSRAEIVEDTTRGLLEDGWLRFRLNGEMQEEDGAYYLYLTPERCEYEVPPVVAGISLHEHPAVQIRTIAEYHEGIVCGGGQIRVSTYLAMTGEFLLFRLEERIFVRYDGRVEKRISDEAAFFFLPELPEGACFSYRIVFCGEGRKEELRIGEGRGLQEQEYASKIPGLCADGMCLMMEREKGSGRYVSAEFCEDFMQAGACDAVFRYDEEGGVFRFGDCDHGAAPEGEILIAAAHSSLGAGGNVKAGSIRCLEDGERRIWVTNGRAAAGGKNAETLSECEERLKKIGDRGGRAVTNEDFERLVMQTPGLMIESAKVLTSTHEKRRRSEGGERGEQENCVTIVVKPCSAQKGACLNEAYRKNILRRLEKKRPIGTRIRLLSPEYIGISLFGEIVVNGQEEAAKTCIEKALETFFTEIGTKFGESVRMSAVYGILDVLPVTSRIVSLTFHARGKDTRKSRNGDLILPANGLAYLKECMLDVTPERQAESRTPLIT